MRFFQTIIRPTGRGNWKGAENLVYIKTHKHTLNIASND